jgi:hypothetical protein
MALLLYGLVGLLIGGALFVLDRLHLVPAAEQTGLDRLGGWILLLFPAVYGIIGGFFGAVAAIFYNGIAAVMGGVEVDLRVKDWGSRAGPPAAGPAAEPDPAGERATAGRVAAAGPTTDIEAGGEGDVGAEAVGADADDQEPATSAS